MTVIEQLTNWATIPASEVFVGFAYSDKPYVVQRAMARDAARGFQKLAEANVARVEMIKGITCVIVDGQTPDASGLKYRVVLSPVDAFT